MSKVKLTKEQAEEIEYYKNNGDQQIDYMVDAHAHNKRPDLKISTLKTSELARALYIGYEVEETFEVGDWLVHWAGEENVIRQAVSNVKDDFIDVEDEEGDTYIWNVKHIRQATLEEIAEEKQRRWWAKHGREVWEVKEGDCLISKYDKHSCQVKFVEAVDEDSVLLVDGIADEYYEGEHDLQILRDSYKVFCFAEDRKDVQE